MKNSLMIGLLVGCLGVGALTLTTQEKTSALERRFLKQNKDLAETSLLDGSFQSTFNTIMSDQLPLRSTSVTAYYSTKRALLSPVMSGLIKMKDDLLYLPEKGLYLKDLLKEDEEKKISTANRGYNIREASERFSDIPFYVYQPIRLEETNLLSDYGITSYGPEYKHLFVMQLGENVTYKELEAGSVEDFENYFYKTDLHWNANGAYRGYCDIVNMLKEDFEIDEPRTPIETVTFDTPFYGNLSNEFGQVTEYDHLSDNIFDLPEYDYYINGVRSTEGHRDEYAKGFKEDAYSDFDYYFGSNEFERRYEFHDESKPNVLIICDSFANPIKTYLASHFNTTVYVDYRAKEVPEDYILDDTIEKYDIDAVIVLMYYHNLYFNGEAFIPLYR